MEARRFRRFGRAHNRSLLSPHVRRLSNTVSCWYCDFKTSLLNEPLFRYGRQYARFLRLWFSVGTGFSLAAMVGVCMVLLWELLRALHLYEGNTRLRRLLSGFLFGFYPSSALGSTISLTHLGYMCISTVISVLIHEFGHALAAASEGVQIEYFAVFLAVLFPGALVAFNYELLQALPNSATLRVYCAGIWHNATCCAGCGFALLLLPLVLCPFYIHGEGLLVLEVPSSSSLSGVVSSGDIITSMDGIHPRDVHEWMEMAINVHEQTLLSSNFSGGFHSRITQGMKGYCVPVSLLEARIQLTDDQDICPDELTAFAAMSCLNSSILDSGNLADDLQEGGKGVHCLSAKDVVRLDKCGDGWFTSPSMNNRSCLCSEDSSCLYPVVAPGLTWVEVAYLSPRSPGCAHLENSVAQVKSSNSEEMSCGGSFVFIGDVISMVRSVEVTAYRPRWSLPFVAYFPLVLEKILACTFRVSLALALLNSLPVYFLDGESIMEVALSYLRWLNPRMKRRILQSCLAGGTLVSVLTFLRMFLFGT